MEYPKGSHIAVGEHWRSSDFDCQCESPDCRITLIKPELVEALDELWDEVDGGLYFTSAYRCGEHNHMIGGSAGSEHRNGGAVDAKRRGLTGKQIAFLAEKIPEFKNGGIGLYKSYPLMAHLDVRGFKVRWTK